MQIRFDGPPGPVAGRFIEVEDDQGRSIRVGRWDEGEEGEWLLKLPGGTEGWLASRVAELEMSLLEIEESALWHCDEDADPADESPEDQTAHVNGLIVQKCRTVLDDAVPHPGKIRKLLIAANALADAITPSILKAAQWRDGIGPGEGARLGEALRAYRAAQGQDAGPPEGSNGGPVEKGGGAR